MEKFTTLRGVAAPLPMVNVDTDMIIPKNFLKTIKRTGLKEGLFYEMRWTADGQKKDFILDQPAYQNAKIIVAGPNFGCGSSREHAPWALEDYGFRAIVAPSFADIFRSNCTKIGLLPVELPAEHVAAIAEAGHAQVDLAAQEVRWPGGSAGFEIDRQVKHRLLNGLDDIALTLEQGDAIEAYEHERERSGPVTTAI